MNINTDRLIDSCAVIAQNIMFTGNAGTICKKGGAWLFDQAMRALDTTPAPVAVTFEGFCRYAGRVFVTIRRDGTYAIRRAETVEKYGIETL